MPMAMDTVILMLIGLRILKDLLMLLMINHLNGQIQMEMVLEIIMRKGHGDQMLVLLQLGVLQSIDGVVLMVMVTAQVTLKFRLDGYHILLV